MLPGGVLLVLLLVAATARGDSSHDFDWFRTFARDGLPALNKSLREELRRSEQLGLRESLLRAEADPPRGGRRRRERASAARRGGAEVERAASCSARAGRTRVADGCATCRRRALVDSARLQLPSRSRRSAQPGRRRLRPPTPRSRVRRSSPSARARRWASPGTRCSSRRSGSPDRSRCPSSAPPRPSASRRAPAAKTRSASKSAMMIS